MPNLRKDENSNYLKSYNMSLSLDGSIRIVGTEFIKLENTGSSNLATEEYVQTQVAEGGGGGGSSWTGYTNLEIDTLLNTKANQSTTYTKTEVDTSLGSKQIARMYILKVK